MSYGIDDLGDRMKMYERVESDARFMPLLPIVARIDGRGFSKFTRGMKRPYDEKMSAAMIATTKRLVEETHALMGYTQSDEITLVWNQDDLRSQIWFDGRKLKMNTALAASATLFFYQEVLKTMPEYANRNPRFDARANNLPNKMEAANNLLWRERDATKNSVSMAARGYYSHNQVDKKNRIEMMDMLMAKGVNWNDYPAFFKRGTFVQRKVLDCPFSAEELAELPPLHKARQDPNLVFQRSRIVVVDMPVFDKVTNRVDVIFNGADPITAGETQWGEYPKQVTVPFDWSKFSEENVDQVVKQFARRAAQRSARGEFGSPVRVLSDASPAEKLYQERRAISIDEARVSHYVTNVEKTEEGFRFEVTPSGPFGSELDKLLSVDGVRFVPRFAWKPVPVGQKPVIFGIIAFDVIPK